jgi:predicted nucleic acid-binding protein
VPHLVDTSVLVDLADARSEHHNWSLGALARAVRFDWLALNPVIFAECLAGEPPLPEPLLERFRRLDLPWSAATLAGPAFGAYRRRGGGKDAILADFLIGAHAAAEGLTLITRDPRRIRTAFPSVRLITPETDPL